MDILRKFGAVPETMLPFHINTTMYLGGRRRVLRHRVDAQDRRLFQLAAQHSLKLAFLARHARAHPGRPQCRCVLG